MGDEDEGSTTPRLTLEQQLDDLRAGRAVEIPGRFVRQQQGRAGDGGAGERDPLLLTAGKLGRIMAQSLAEANRTQGVARRLEGIAPTGQFQGNRDIFPCRHGGNQMERLEDDSDMAAAKIGEAVLVESREILARDDHLAAARAIDSGDDRQQAGLAGARWPDNGNGFIHRHGQVNTRKNVDRPATAGQGHVNILQPDDWNSRIQGQGREAIGWERTILRAYGPDRRQINLLVSLLTVLWLSISPALAASVKILAFGDSLTAGLGLPLDDAFPTRLQAALAAKGYDATVINAGISGDTTAGGLARLDWTLADHPDYVLVELGANDALRGIDPKLTRSNLDQILAKLHAAGVKTILLGMKAPGNWGPGYAAAFDRIYPDLAAKYGIPLYPFLLDGVALDPKLNQADMVHPNAAGVEIIVAKILPLIEFALGR